MFIYAPFYSMPAGWPKVLPTEHKLKYITSRNGNFNLFKISHCKMQQHHYDHDFPS